VIFGISVLGARAVQKSHKDIFAITLIKTLAVFVAIGFYYMTGLY
jgi:hypothetical protein